MQELGKTKGCENDPRGVNSGKSILENRFGMRKAKLAKVNAGLPRLSGFRTQSLPPWGWLQNPFFDSLIILTMQSGGFTKAVSQWG
jgi:hypothetical protein